MEPSEFNITTLNSLENNLNEFVLFRTRENLKRPIFSIVIGDNFTQQDTKLKTKAIIDYLFIWINLSIKKITIDFLQSFQPKDIRNDKVYVFNLSSIQHIIRDESTLLNINDNEIVSSHFYSYLIDNCGPMIFIANKLNDIPVQIRSISNAIFILPSENMETVLGGVSRHTFNKNLEYKMDSILVFDGMNCENKLSIFQNFFC